MSILSVRNIQGISAYSNTINIPSGHKLSFAGDLKIPVWSTTTRPLVPEIGLLGYNTTDKVVELYNGTEWVSVGGSTVLDGTTEAKAATSATAILQVKPSSPSGYYWIKPTTSSVAKYVYCDMTTDGGGWMLLINARANNGGQYYNNNEYGLSVVNGVSRVVEYNKATTSMYSRTEINEFFQISGFKYGRITPVSGVTLTSPFTGLYQRIGTTTSARWGGTDFDCSNRGALAGTTNYGWVITQYQNWSEVQSGTNAQDGTYTGGNHYYPTTYANAYQNFWKGDQDGIRFSSTFRGENYSAIGQNTVSGYFWIKTT